MTKIYFTPIPDAGKLEAIKALREIVPGLGLHEAKAIVEAGVMEVDPIRMDVSSIASLLRRHSFQNVRGDPPPSQDLPAVTERLKGVLGRLTARALAKVVTQLERLEDSLP